MAEMAGGRVISGAREVSRDALMDARGLRGDRAWRAGRRRRRRNRRGPAQRLCVFRGELCGAASGRLQRAGQLARQEPEIAYVLNDCGAKAIVAHADLLPEVSPAMPVGVPLFVVPTPPEIAAAYGVTDKLCRPPVDALLWEDLVTCFPPLPEAPAGAISSMIYTSGTTGNPKGVRRLNIGSETAQLFASLARQRLWPFTGSGDARSDHRPALSFVRRTSSAFRPSAWRALAILQPRFDAEELLHLIEQYRITPSSHGADHVCPAAAPARRR